MSLVLEIKLSYLILLLLNTRFQTNAQNRSDTETDTENTGIR